MRLPTLTFAVVGILTLSTIHVAHAIDSDITVSEATTTEVLFATINTPEDALVVIHPIKSGGDNRTPDTALALGSVAVKAGQHTNVKLQLDPPAAKGRLLAVLYKDTGETGQFEPKTDKPLTDAEGKIISDRFKVK